MVTSIVIELISPKYESVFTGAKLCITDILIFMWSGAVFFFMAFQVPKDTAGVICFFGLINLYMWIGFILVQHFSKEDEKWGIGENDGHAGVWPFMLIHILIIRIQRVYYKCRGKKLFFGRCWKCLQFNKVLLDLETQDRAQCACCGCRIQGPHYE